MNAMATDRSRLPGTPEPMHHWAGAEGLQIAGDSWGNPTDPLVVLLHGGGQTRHAWKGAGQMLAGAGWYAVALDARGHGDSAWAPPGHYSDDLMVEDVVCVVRALGRDEAVFVGASMGGMTCLLAVGEERVGATALVLVDIAPKVEQVGRARVAAFMEQYEEGFDSLEEVADAIARYRPNRPRPGNLDGLAKNVRLGADGRYYWHWDPKYRAHRLSVGERVARVEECAARIEVPTLLVRGGLSDVVSEEGANAFLELCPHAEYVNVAGATHMVAGDRNDVFAGAVIEFLGRRVRAS
jgi:non-heme chloroperoxidase